MARPKLQNLSRGQLLIPPERMKWLGQRGNSVQLWKCLLMKVKFDIIKTNIA